MRYILVLMFLLGSGSLAWAQEDDAAQAAADQRKVAALMRLTKIDVNEKPTLKAAVLRHLQTVTDESKYLEYAERFKLSETDDRLWEIVVKSENDSHRVAAASLLLRQNDTDDVLQKINIAERPELLLAPISLVTSKKALEILKMVLRDSRGNPVALNLAAKGLGRQKSGQEFLLKLVREDKLPDAVEFTTANVLISSVYPEIKAAAAKSMTLPSASGSKPLSPLAELVKKRGSVSVGAQVFRGKEATCSNCHRVNGAGKEVGPDLSEIGSKLSRQAMYESILNPNAAVSHNYETYLARTIDGLDFAGILISETDDAVTLRTAEALTKTIEKEDLDGMRKSPNSLMPADLQKNLTEQELVDLVEYLMTLTKK